MVSRDDESTYLNQRSQLHRSIKPEPHLTCNYHECKPFLPAICKAPIIVSHVKERVKVSQQSWRSFLFSSQSMSRL